MAIDPMGGHDLSLPAVTAVDAFLREVLSDYPRQKVARSLYSELKEILRSGSAEQDALRDFYERFCDA